MRNLYFWGEYKKFDKFSIFYIIYYNFNYLLYNMEIVDKVPKTSSSEQLWDNKHINQIDKFPSVKLAEQKQGEIVDNLQNNKEIKISIDENKEVKKFPWEDMFKTFKNHWDSIYRNTWAPYFGRIPKEDAKEAAKAYWEWYKPLTDFLEICIRNGIATTACCAGHKENDESYVSFDISDERTKKLVEFLVENKIGCELQIGKIKSKNGREMCQCAIYTKMDERDAFYEACIEKIKEITENEEKIKGESKKHVVEGEESLIRKLISFSEWFDFEYGNWWIIRFNTKTWKIIYQPYCLQTY